MFLELQFNDFFLLLFLKSVGTLVYKTKLLMHLPQQKTESLPNLFLLSKSESSSQDVSSYL